MTSKGNLSRLTLVVPTYERQDFALRLINFWADKGVHLIVLDGSATPIEPAKLDIFGPHIQYLHRPVGIYQRLSESIELVQTEYVALAGDDEFYLPSAVEACIKELDENIGLVACCGRALAFGLKEMHVYGRAQYPRLEAYALNSETPKDRVLQHMRNYVPSLIYAICRTPQWGTALKYTVQKEFPFFASSELRFEMSMAYAGQSKVISQLMWLRSHGETRKIRGATSPSMDESRLISSWWADSSKVKEHEEFITIMSQGFSELLPDDGEDIREAAIAGVEAYLDFYRNHKSSRGVLKKLSSLVIKIIPGFAKPFLRSICSESHRYKSGEYTGLLQAARAIEDSGVHVDFHALEEIQKTIVQFHKNRYSLGF